MMESLFLAVLRFDMQVATFELVREPIDVPFDWWNASYWIVDCVLCIVQFGAPAYFKIYKFDERWQLVEDIQFCWPNSDFIPRLPGKMVDFACSRLWSYDRIQHSDSLAPMTRIQYIECDESQLRDLCLEPLPLKCGELEAWAKCETNDDQVGWRFERFPSLLASFLGVQICD